MASKIHLIAKKLEGGRDYNGRPLAIGVNNSKFNDITDNRGNSEYETVTPDTAQPDSRANGILVARGMIGLYKQLVSDGQVRQLVHGPSPSNIYLAVIPYLEEHQEDNKLFEHMLAVIQWDREDEMKELITDCSVLVEMPQPYVGDYMNTAERTQHGFKTSFGRFSGVPDEDRWLGDRASIARMETLLNQIPIGELIKDLSFEEIDEDVTLRRILHEQLRAKLCNGGGRYQMPVSHVVGVSHEGQTLESFIAHKFEKSYLSFGKTRGPNANCRRIDYQSPDGVRTLSIPNRTTLTRNSKVLIVGDVDTTAECVRAAIQALVPYELAAAPKILTLGGIQGLENLDDNLIDIFAPVQQPALQKLQIRFG